MQQHYVLYGWPGSGSLAVQVALEEAGAVYERVWVARDAGSLAHFRAAVTPTGKAPALRLPDGSVMFESAATLAYIPAAHPQAGLAPTPGTPAHAAFLKWMVFLSTGLYEPVLRMYYPERYSDEGAAAAPGIAARAAREFSANLELVVAGLDPYVLGSAYSTLDPYLYMLASWWNGDMAELHRRLPALARHATLMSARSVVGKVEADHAQ